MSDQDRDNQPDVTGTDEDTNTADVREAIERAKEASEGNLATSEPTPDSVSEDEQGETIEPSGLTPEEHADTNTEAMAPVHEPVTITGNTEMPSAAPVEATVVPSQVPPVVPAPVTISADHPMAALYMQQPDPPVVKSNRVAGLFITLLATVGFGVVYAGLIAAWLAPKFPPSTFLQEGLYPYLVSLGFVIPVVAFFISMLLLVLIFNRAGWWVYVIFGLLVAAIVWISAGIGYSMSPQLLPESIGAEHNIRRYLEFALTIPALLAALSAREVSVWFGAWIGARGRRIKAKNRVAQQEYEQKLAELKVQTTP